LRARFEPYGEILDCKIAMLPEETPKASPHHLSLAPENAGPLVPVGLVRFVNRQMADDAIQALHGEGWAGEEGETVSVRYAESPHLSRRYRAKSPRSPHSPRIPPHLVPVMDPYGVPLYMVDPMGFSYPMLAQGMYPLPPSAPGMGRMSPHGVPIVGPVPMNMPPPPNAMHLNLGDMDLSPRSHQAKEDLNLFIFHLPPETDDQALVKLFEPFGPIESAKVMVDKNTGESKGYGFVQFVNQTDAERALSMNGKSLGSKRLSVSYKTPSPRASATSSPRHGPVAGTGYSPSSPRHAYPPSPLSSPRAAFPPPPHFRPAFSPRGHRAEESL